MSHQLTEAIGKLAPDLQPSGAALTDPFSFLASVSARADSGCSSVRCRIRLLSALGRYAALYCDRVVVPFEVHLDPGLGVDYARERLLRRLVTLTELRPLIEAGIVELFVPRLCPHCMVQKLPGATGVAELAKTIAEERFGEFAASYLPNRRTVGIKVEGPPDLFDHGAITRELTPIPEWLPVRLRRLGRKHPPVPLSRRTLRKSRLVEHVFQAIAADVIHQRLEGMDRPLNYLMARKGEAEFLSRLHIDQELERRRAAFFDQLSHVIPTLMDVPIEVVLRIRQKRSRELS